MINLTLPIYWTQHFKTKNDKTVLVGMNFYRNAHYHNQNKMKQYFSDLVKAQLNDVVITDQFKVQYIIYYKNPNCDGANIAALIEKFTLDALQENNVIINDNVKFHKGSTWKISGQDKDNPRCEISVTKI
jgi:U3 small nucleolar RNA-associated protein 14